MEEKNTRKNIIYTIVMIAIVIAVISIINIANKNQDTQNQNNIEVVEPQPEDNAVKEGPTTTQEITPVEGGVPQE